MNRESSPKGDAESQFESMELRRIVPRSGSAYPIRILGGNRERLWADAYHGLTRMSWTRLFGLAVVIYAALNVGFAGLYLLGGDCISNADRGSFVDALSFSVQTLATIGYGVMAPKTTWAHVLVAIEALCGVLSFAMITGIVFAKFSRPTARVLFTDVACIGPYDGRRVLMFRMANERAGSRIVEARVRVTLTRDETTSEGVFMRRFYDLGLVREWTPIFALSWTAMHVIDETSPLFGFDREALCRNHAEIVVSFSGLDEHLSQPVHGRHSYVATEIRFGARFTDVMSFDADGFRVFDLDRFHETLSV